MLATLPCEMCSRNRHAQELRKQTAKQDSNCHARFIHCRNKDKRLRSKIFSHIINVSDGVSWQVKISQHQFDNKYCYIVSAKSKSM